MNDATFVTMYADMLACFAAFGVVVVGKLGESLVLDRQHLDGPRSGSRVHDLWTVCDNGGELNVARINDSDSLRSIPYTSFGEVLDGATMAHRVRVVLDGEDINWSRRMGDTLDELKEHGASVK